MMRPHPPRLRMKRRKTVSVTPAIGARTVAGEMLTVPMVRLAGTGFSKANCRPPVSAPLGCTGAAWRTEPALSVPKGVSAPHVPPELSQNFFTRSEEHTSELQSLRHLVCRLLLEKTKDTERPPLWSEWSQKSNHRCSEGYVDHRGLHSFPTRRSSDLVSAPHVPPELSQNVFH